MRFMLMSAVLIPFLLFNNYAWGVEKHIFKETLNKFVQEALVSNPELQAAKQRIHVLKEVPPQAGSLKDPMFKFELMNIPVDSFSFSDQAMTQKQIMISQELPYPGKRKLRSESAQKNVVIARENLNDLQLNIIKQVKVAYYEYCFLKIAIEITEQNKILLLQFITIAEAKYAVGKGIQQDVLKAQVEMSKIIDKLIEMNQLKENEIARLNILMNRLPQASLKIPHGIKKSPFPYKIEELQEMAVANRPFLKALTSSIDKYKITSKLAEKEYYPNFTVGFKYGQREDSRMQDHPDFVSGFIGLNIPIWHKSKQRRKVAEENFKIDMARENYNAAKNKIFLNIKLIVDKKEKNSQLISLINSGILLQARQALESALAAYSVDKVDFLTLLDNQVTLFNWEIKSHRELTNYEKNLADLEHVVGQELF